MQAAEVRSTIDAALDQLTADLEGGKSQSLVAYLETMGRFHNYSFGNILLIASQCPHATHVAGYRAWNTFSRYVRQGEKGIAIFAPMLLKPRDGGTKAPFIANNIHEEKTKGGRILRFRVVYVFDITQTEGEPLPSVPTMSGDPATHLETLRAHVRDSGITLDYDPGLHDAEGVSEGGRIRLRVGLSAAEEFATLTHELAHERMHRGPDRRDIPHRQRELEAEAVAFVVSRAVGLETGTASSDYIAMYGGSKDALAASLARIQKESAAIIDALTGDTAAAEPVELAAA